MSVDSRKSCEYRHSGKLGASAFTLPILGALVASWLGIIYGFALVYIPIVGYVSVVLTVLYGAGLGWVISKIGHYSKCRNGRFLAGMAALLAVLSLYVSWAAFEFALFGGDLSDIVPLVASPSAVWTLARNVAENGWYSVFGLTPRGLVLWVLWAIEALIVVGFASLIASGGLSGGVYCEPCNRWCKSAPNFARFQRPVDLTWQRHVAPTDLTPLTELPPPEATDGGYVRVDTWCCDRCANTAALQIQLMSVSTDSDGVREDHARPVTAVWLVPRAALASIPEVARQSVSVP